MKRLLNALKTAGIWVLYKGRQFFNWLLPTKSEKENVLQYILRQFLLVDSDGNPSVTITILFSVMFLIAIIAFTEVELAKSWVYTYGIKGELLSKAMKGFSSNFLLIAISLAGVVTYYFQKRERSRKEGDPLHPNIPDIKLPGVLDNIKNKVTDMLKSAGKDVDIDKTTKK